MKSQLMNLVALELYASKKHLYLFFIVPAVYPALFRGSAGSDVVSYLFCTCICGFLLFTGFAESDEKYKTNIMLNLLPVKRSEIVNARYLSMYIVYAGVTLIYIVSAMLLHIVKPDLFVVYHFSAIPIGLLALSVINAVQVPLYYVLDLQKSRLIGTLIMFGVIVVLGLISSKGLLTPPLHAFAAMNEAARNCILLISAAIIFVLSSMVTETIYRRKEI